MLRMMFAAFAAVVMLTGAANAQEQLHNAMVAAMGEAIEDPGYLKITAKYGLPAPDLAHDKTLVNSKDHPYPKVTDGTLLDRAIKSGVLRLGWIAVGTPWSVPGKDKDPVGFAVDYWQIIVAKLNAHYKSTIKLKWVEFSASKGNNDMYLWLATDADPTCAKLDTGSVENCYDIIGGAYAIDARRLKITHVTPAYYPLNMSVVRTKAPLEGADDLDTAEKILAAIADPKRKLVIAGLPDTGESLIMENWKKKFGDTFTMVLRPASSDVLEFAASTKEAHFVMGTNVRLAATRFKKPDVCGDCKFVPNVQVFGGVGFATALLGK